MLAKAERIAADQPPTFKSPAAFYLKVLRGIIDNGNSFANSEKERLERVASSGHLNPAKTVEIQKRVNILKALLEPVLAPVSAPEELA
mmetsp:Transcript_19815/g.32490  ORF Transcript_19815/g.32490 Transcript_19815/m.32490 type:complete len:88 (-) Transcript_19815:281-544(-)